MIFLDTNAFYYASQISSNNEVDCERLRDFIRKSKMALSSVSFYEFLVKFRNSIDTIHIGGSFLADNRFKIVYNKYFDYHSELECDYTCITEAELKKILEIVIADKIYTESRFAAIVYSMMLFSGFYFYFLPNGDQEEDIKKSIFEACFKLWTKDSIESFQLIFKEGYKSDNCEKDVKNAVRNLLEYTLAITFPIFDASVTFQTFEEFEELIKEFHFTGTAAQKQISKIEKYDSSIVYLSKLAKKYNESQNEKLPRFVDNLMQPIENSVKEKGLQEYLREIADRSCKYGSPFMKNDILDAIILCNIENKYNIISFDDGMINHMKKYSNQRKTYADSLEIIRLFKDI